MSDTNAYVGLVVTAPSASNMSAVQRQIRSQLSNIGLNVQFNNAKQLQQQIDKSTKGVHDFGEAVGLAGRRFVAYTSAVAIVGRIGLALSRATSDAIRFEKEFVKIAQVLDTNVSSIKGLETSITSLSRAYALSANIITKTGVVLAQSGLNARGVEKALEALTKTTLASTFGDIANTAEGAVAIIAQFREGAGSLERQLGAVNAVSKKFAVESQDIIDAVKRAGGAFQAAGGNFEEFIALFTSVRSTTRESAETIATGFRTIFARIQRPKTIEYFRELNIELADAAGNLVDPYTAIRRLSEGLDKLGIKAGSVKFAQVIEELGGIRQVSRVIPLLQRFTTAEEARQVAIAGGTSLDADAAKAKETLAFKIEEVRQNFSALIREISQDSALKLMINIALRMANSFIEVARAIKFVIPLLATVSLFKFSKFAGNAIRRGFSPTEKALYSNSGGFVPGFGDTDTVPAMLTPGEFVINKKSAKAIGYGELGRLNKYAKGGIVSKVQKFSNGGIVDDDDKPLKSVQEAKSIIRDNLQYYEELQPKQIELILSNITEKGGGGQLPVEINKTTQIELINAVDDLIETLGTSSQKISNSNAELTQAEHAALAAAERRQGIDKNPFNKAAQEVREKARQEKRQQSKPAVTESSRVDQAAQEIKVKVEAVQASEAPTAPPAKRRKKTATTKATSDGPVDERYVNEIQYEKSRQAKFRASKDLDKAQKTGDEDDIKHFQEQYDRYAEDFLKYQKIHDENRKKAGFVKSFNPESQESKEKLQPRAQLELLTRLGEQKTPLAERVEQAVGIHKTIANRKDKIKKGPNDYLSKEDIEGFTAELPGLEQQLEALQKEVDDLASGKTAAATTSPKKKATKKKVATKKKATKKKATPTPTSKSEPVIPEIETTVVTGQEQAEEKTSAKKKAAAKKAEADAKKEAQRIARNARRREQRAEKKRQAAEAAKASTAISVQKPESTTRPADSEYITAEPPRGLIEHRPEEASAQQPRKRLGYSPELKALSHPNPVPSFLIDNIEAKNKASAKHEEEVSAKQPRLLGYTQPPKLQEPSPLLTRQSQPALPTVSKVSPISSPILHPTPQPALPSGLLDILKTEPIESKEVKTTAKKHPRKPSSDNIFTEWQADIKARFETFARRQEASKANKKAQPLYPSLPYDDPEIAKLTPYLNRTAELDDIERQYDERPRTKKERKANRPVYPKDYEAITEEELAKLATSVSEEAKVVEQAKKPISANSIGTYPSLPYDDFQLTGEDQSNLADISKQNDVSPAPSTRPKIGRGLETNRPYRYAIRAQQIRVQEQNPQQIGTDETPYPGLPHYPALTDEKLAELYSLGEAETVEQTRKKRPQRRRPQPQRRRPQPQRRRPQPQQPKQLTDAELKAKSEAHKKASEEGQRKSEQRRAQETSDYVSSKTPTSLETAQNEFDTKTKNKEVIDKTSQENINAAKEDFDKATKEFNASAKDFDAAKKAFRETKDAFKKAESARVNSDRAKKAAGSKFIEKKRALEDIEESIKTIDENIESANKTVRRAARKLAEAEEAETEIQNRIQEIEGSGRSPSKTLQKKLEKAKSTVSDRKDAHDNAFKIQGQRNRQLDKALKKRGVVEGEKTTAKNEYIKHNTGLESNESLAQQARSEFEASRIGLGETLTKKEAAKKEKEAASEKVKSVTQAEKTKRTTASEELIKAKERLDIEQSASASRTSNINARNKRGTTRQTTLDQQPNKTIETLSKELADVENQIDIGRIANSDKKAKTRAATSVKQFRDAGSVEDKRVDYNKELQTQLQIAAKKYGEGSKTYQEVTDISKKYGKTVQEQLIIVKSYTKTLEGAEEEIKNKVKAGTATEGEKDQLSLTKKANELRSRIDKTEQSKAVLYRPTIQQDIDDKINETDFKKVSKQESIKELEETLRVAAEIYGSGSKAYAELEKTIKRFDGDIKKQNIAANTFINSYNALEKGGKKVIPPVNNTAPVVSSKRSEKTNTSYDPCECFKQVMAKSACSGCKDAKKSKTNSNIVVSSDGPSQNTNNPSRRSGVGLLLAGQAMFAAASASQELSQVFLKEGEEIGEFGKMINNASSAVFRFSGVLTSAYGVFETLPSGLQESIGKIFTKAITTKDIKGAKGIKSFVEGIGQSHGPQPKFSTGRFLRQSKDIVGSGLKLDFKPLKSAFTQSLQQSSILKYLKSKGSLSTKSLSSALKLGKFASGGIIASLAPAIVKGVSAGLGFNNKDYSKDKQSAIEAGNVEKAKEAVVGESAQKLLSAITIIGAGLTLLSGPIGLVVAGFGALGSVLYDNNSSFKSFIDSIVGSADGLFNLRRDSVAAAESQARVNNATFKYGRSLTEFDKKRDKGDTLGALQELDASAVVFNEGIQSEKKSDNQTSFLTELTGIGDTLSEKEAKQSGTIAKYEEQRAQLIQKSLPELQNLTSDIVNTGGGFNEFYDTLDSKLPGIRRALSETGELESVFEQLRKKIELLEFEKIQKAVSLLTSALSDRFSRESDIRSITGKKTTIADTLKFTKESSDVELFNINKSAGASNSLDSNLATSKGLGEFLTSIRATDAAIKSVKDKANTTGIVFADLNANGQSQSYTLDELTNIQKLQGQALLNSKALINQHTAAIKSELQARNDAIRSLNTYADNFIFASNEQRRSMKDTFEAARRLSESGGNINSISESQRGPVSQLLNEFKDIPLFNGKTGSQVLGESRISFLGGEEAIRGKLKGQGLGNEEIEGVIDQIRNGSVSENDKLVQDLKQLNELQFQADLVNATIFNDAVSVFKDSVILNAEIARQEASVKQQKAEEKKAQEKQEATQKIAPLLSEMKSLEKEIQDTEKQIVANKDVIDTDNIKRLHLKASNNNTNLDDVDVAKERAALGDTDFLENARQHGRKGNYIKAAANYALAPTQLVGGLSKGSDYTAEELDEIANYQKRKLYNDGGRLEQLQKRKQETEQKLSIAQKEFTVASQSPDNKHLNVLDAGITKLRRPSPTLNLNLPNIAIPPSEQLPRQTPSMLPSSSRPPSISPVPIERRQVLPDMNFDGLLSATEALKNAASTLPTEINMNMGSPTVKVIIDGAQVLANLMPAVKTLVMGSIIKELTEFEKLQNAGSSYGAANAGATTLP